VSQLSQSRRNCGVARNDLSFVFDLCHGADRAGVFERASINVGQTRRLNASGYTRGDKAAPHWRSWRMLEAFGAKGLVKKPHLSCRQHPDRWSLLRGLARSVDYLGLLRLIKRKLTRWPGNGCHADASLHEPRGCSCRIRVR
jgi:hypothetical protein